MNVLKPQKSFLKELKNANFSEVIDRYKEEKIELFRFENQEQSGIEIYDVDFEHCEFNKITLLNSKIEKATFKDVIFNNCNFSNTSFMNTTFIRCEFNYCKLEGSNFAEGILHNVSFSETNAKYLNLSLASLDKVAFENTILRNSYFQENKLKEVQFKKADLTQAQFFKTSLKNIDISDAAIEGIAISIDDVRGAIVDQMQALDLLYLIGVKIKPM